MRKVLILCLLMGIAILIAEYISKRRNVVSKDTIAGKITQVEDLSPDETDVVGRFTEIMKRYGLGDGNMPCSMEDSYKLIEDLTHLRTYIADKNVETQITPSIDQLFHKVTRHISLQRYQKEEYQPFSTVGFLEDKLLNSHQVMSLDSIRTGTEKVKHTRKLRRKIIELMGGFPKKIPLNPRLVEVKNYDKYRMEKIIFDSEPGVSVPAWLLIPKGISLPAPAIICLHQHAGQYYLGKDEVVGLSGDDPTQFYAKELAERGYITFAIDARCFGERFDDEGLADYLARWQGKSLLGMIIWDDVRSVDYLLTRNEIDSDRIGCIGHSLGGTRATYLAALDDRIKIAVVSSYVTSYKSLSKNNRFVPPSTWLAGILKYADCQEILSLIAPRPLLIINGEKDEYAPIEGTLKVYNSVKRIYKIFNAEDKLKKIIIPEPHAFPKDIREEAYQWLDKWLKRINEDK